MEDEGVGEENGHVDEEGDESMGVSKSPTTTSTTTQTNYSRKHGRDDGINGVSNTGATGGGTSHKRRKKAVSGPDGDTPMVGGFPETPVTVTEEPRVTNGSSVGVQVEGIVEITAEDSVILGQEDKSILICAWNPIHSNVLATASQDSIARVWNVPIDATSSTSIQNKVILHDPSNSPNRDVTAIRWSPQGDLIATGSYDGQTRIWTTDGLLRYTLPPHHGPVIALKWNKLADTLLSLSCDGKVIAWDALTGDMRRSFEQAIGDQGRGDQTKGGQAEAATDMDWISGRQFATCGNGGSVGIYDLDHDSSLNTNTSHSGEVNCLVWDECSERLASGGEGGDVLVRLLLSTGPLVDLNALANQLDNLDLGKALQDPPTLQITRAHRSRGIIMLATNRLLLVTPISKANPSIRLKRLPSSPLGRSLKNLYPHPKLP